MRLLKQDPKKALFEDLLWSRPENKRAAGKLLIIGGQAGDFINVSSCYSFAKEAGAGTIRLILPDSLRKIASRIDGVELAASNSSGSFARAALASFFENSEWSDHVLLAGDFGNSAETTIILDGFLLRGIKPITISQNALPSIGIGLEQLVHMPFNLIIARKIFQKIATAMRSRVPVTSITTYNQMASILEEISNKTKASYTVVDEEHTWCAYKSEVVSTQTKPLDLNALSAYSAVWFMQNPKNPLKATVTAVNQAINLA